MRILYIYAGGRKDKIDGPKTQFYGLHSLMKMGEDVSYLEFTDVYPNFLAEILPFNIRHMLMYFPSRNYDIVFGSALLPMMVLKAFFGGRAKYILLNISLTRLLSSNRNKGLKIKIIHFLLLKLDGIISLSRAQAQYLKKNIRFPEEKIFVAPLGVDTEFYRPAISESAVSTLHKDSVTHDDTIISVGRDNGRDYTSVFSVAEMLSERKFIVVCSRRNTEGLTVPKNVTIIYDAPAHELLSLYRKSKLLLLLTKDRKEDKDGADCSGQTVLLEAMSVGLPAIVTHNPCLAEYVTHNENAVFVKPGDVEDAVQKIQDLDNEEFRNVLAKNSEKAIRTKYSEKIMAEHLFDIFRQVYRTVQKPKI